MAHDLLERLVQSAPAEQRRRLAEELRYLAARLTKACPACESGAPLDPEARGTEVEKPKSEKEARRPPGVRRARSTDEISWLYLNSAFYGMGTSLTFSVLGEADSAAGYAFPMVALTGAAIGGVAMLDRRTLGYGIPHAMVSGMYIGLEEGVIALGLMEANDVDYDEQGVALTLWIPSTVGLVGGGVFSSLVGTTPGQASFVHSGGLWSGATGLLLALAASDELTEEQGWNTIAVAYNAGLIAAVLGAGAVEPRVSRVRFLDLGALGGGLAIGGILVGAEAEPRAIAGGTALGIIGGVGLAWYLTRNLPKDEPDDLSRAPRVGLQPIPGGATLGLSGTF